MKLPADYYRKQTNVIVVFEIELVHIKGKFKISRNRSAEDRSGDDNSIEVARYIQHASR